MDSLFIVLSWLLGIMTVFYGWMLWRGGGWCAGTCRWRWQALILGLPCLVWCARHGCLMLEGPLASLHPVVWLLVPVLAVMSWFLTDYLFTRSVGGFIVLSANELLHRGFADDVAMRPLYSIVCLLLGVAGLFMIGVPWRLRLLLSDYGGKKAGRMISIAAWLCALILVVLPFFCGYVKK